jgi:hypothetical protein
VSRTRIHIGTTEGPADIQRLTAEPPEIRSVVCLDGRAVALPISRDYEAFVRRPTGIIERIWGGQAFRMDVGARITDGLSWQLGAFLAHALHESGQLATAGVAPDTVVWATGEVDAGLAIRPVDDIPRKLELSAELLRGLAPLRPFVMVPAEAEAAARTAIDALGLAAACRLRAVARAEDALAAIGLALPGATPRRSEPASPRSRRRVAWGVAAVVLLAVVLLAIVAPVGWTALTWRRTFLAWTDQATSGDLIALDQTLDRTGAEPGCLTCGLAVRRFRAWLATNLPDDDGPLIEAEGTRRSPYGGCRPPPPAGPAPVRVALADPSGPTVGTGLCRVRYVASGAPDIALIVSPRQPPDAVSIGAGEASVTLDLPALYIYASEQRVIALGSKLPLDAVLAWLRPQIPPPPAALPEPLVARLAALGIAARTRHHRVDPERGL